MKNPVKYKKENYVMRYGLLQRGWTDGLIAMFLTPDLTMPNPLYKHAAETKLYLLQKVEALEQTPEFKVMFQSAQGRKKSAKQAAGTKKKALFDFINSMVIKLPEFTQDELFKRAVNSYNEHKAFLADRHNDYFEPATVGADEEFLKRISVNYLRHQCTQYEDVLEGMFGKTGKQEGYEMLKARINAAILHQYNFLK